MTDRTHYIVIDCQWPDDDYDYREAKVFFDEDAAYRYLEERDPFGRDVDRVLAGNPVEDWLHDVSAALCDRWWELAAPTFDPDADVIPAFVARHIKVDLDELREEREAEAAYVQEVSSPYWAGRVA